MENGLCLVPDLWEQQAQEGYPKWHTHWICYKLALKSAEEPYVLNWPILPRLEAFCTRPIRFYSTFPWLRNRALTDQCLGVCRGSKPAWALSTAQMCYLGPRVQWACRFSIRLWLYIKKIHQAWALLDRIEGSAVVSLAVQCAAACLEPFLVLSFLVIGISPGFF